MVDVDKAGFDYMDRKLLEAIIEKFTGGPVGLENLAAAIGEERDTIEDVLEPYLIQQGFYSAHPARTDCHSACLSTFRIAEARVVGGCWLFAAGKELVKWFGDWLVR